jgi:hypothetical protein
MQPTPSNGLQPYYRDSDDGGKELVVPLGGSSRDYLTFPVSPMRALRLAKDLLDYAHSKLSKR